jgi:hypothetical protein
VPIIDADPAGVGEHGGDPVVGLQTRAGVKILTRSRARWIATALLAANLASCVAGEPPAQPPFTSSRVEHDRPFRNWGAHPSDLETLLAEEPFEIATIEAAGSGVTGASRATLAFANGATVEVKWKAFPPALDDWNNSPRKELAAYEIQKLFLTPEEYVVPTTVVRCVDLEQARSQRPDVQATVEGTRCVLVVFSVWMQHVTAPEDLYDAERFQRDPAYALHLANLNVLTHLIDHRDGRKGNLLLGDESGPSRAYAADNGISFGPWIWNYFVTNWNELRVPALPRRTVGRLRDVVDEDTEKLRVLVELALDDEGIYRPVAAPHRPIDPAKGARRDGRVLQLGLTGNEIDAVRDRLAELLEAVDRAEVAEF